MRKRIISIIIPALTALLLSFSATAMEYEHELVSETVNFAWTVEGENIHVMLSAKTTSWVGVGFDPEDAMKGANFILGYINKDRDRIKVEDHYGDRRIGHKSDTKLGGTNDIITSSAKEENGVTTITFTIPLKADDKWDKPIDPSGITRILLAHGKGRDSLRSQHRYRVVYDVNLSTGESKKIK